MAQDEGQIWRDLIASDGWQRLREYAQSQWSAATIEGHVTAALDAPDDAVAVSKLRQIMVAKRAVFGILGYPEVRIHALRQAAEQGPDPAHVGRRGAL